MGKALLWRETMKLLLLAVFLTSCAIDIPRRSFKGNHISRMEQCVFRLVEDNGVSAGEAHKVCEGIYRRKR